ncbi:helix-turn-helix transcriptional regulator [Kribbella jiaozuonensis]|uniref:LuxR family transcriptional regulator n=1 Tax=Kribbella jiaozuonensis TaxID=2575441 RepID=A0A4V5UXB4_9ACTN|nr:LuxR family transcriptional regulator [Kribbella jiaozuonensis]TKK80143.1 LuxR family transcriptional regulator [Kribbella jiaozuonensis]
MRRQREGSAALHGRRSECVILEDLVAGARAGRSQVLVLRGAAGIGKTSLLDYLETYATGFRVARSAGVEAEMELPYAGLHQLCGPFANRLDRLPDPQRIALGTAFGVTVGAAPDRFLVGLAALDLLADRAEQQPLLCLVDDAQWLDHVSAQTIAFVARRLLAERIVLVIAIREPSDGLDFAGLPELTVDGLAETDAGRLLDSVIKGPIDPRVRDRIIAETRGNPLALLELPRAWTAAELADGFEESDLVPPSSRIDQIFLRRIATLPDDTRQLLVTAAAEPLGDAELLWRAAGVLGLSANAGQAAETAGLIKFGSRVGFRHPLVRAAAYRSAAPEQRQEIHRALAEATDAEVDPDRRAWHRAQAAPAPDEEIAAELERSATRAQSRGGLLAAAALLERAARLTPDPARRAQRQLAAAWRKRDGGALDAALTLLAEVASGPADAFRAAEVTHLRGQIAFDQRRSTEAARLLLDAAPHLEPLDCQLARETYLDALAAAIWASGTDEPDTTYVVASAARCSPAADEVPRVIDRVLDALARRFTDGHDAAVAPLARALAAVRGIDGGAKDVGRLLWLGGNRVTAILATELWDFGAGRAVAELQVRRARDAGALVQLQFALNVLAANELLAGQLTHAAELVEEDRMIAGITGNRPVGYAATLLAALRGPDDAAPRLITTVRDEAAALGQGRIVTFSDYASSVLNNGLGRHDLAAPAARSVFDRDVVGGYQIMAVSELAEAASRTGDTKLIAVALERMSERARVTPTDWALGIEARLRALQGGEQADASYRLSIEHLDRAGLRLELARGHLLYGEWLRREGLRIKAKEHLLAAHGMLSEMGAAVFAERARGELVPLGVKAPRRSVETTEELTTQEFHIARLARDGLSNAEIGTRLFLSPRTVEWHLGKVFSKLGVNSRRELRTAVPDFAPE